MATRMSFRTSIFFSSLLASGLVLGCSGGESLGQGDDDVTGPGAQTGTSRPQFVLADRPDCVGGFELSKEFAVAQQEDEALAEDPNADPAQRNHFIQYDGAPYFFDTMAQIPAQLGAPKHVAADGGSGSVVKGMRLKVTKGDNIAYVNGKDWCYVEPEGTIYIRPQPWRGPTAGHFPGSEPVVGPVRQALEGESQVPVLGWGGWRELDYRDALEIEYVVGPEATCDGGVKVGDCDFGGNGTDGKGACLRPYADPNPEATNSQWKKVVIDETFPGHSIKNQCNNF